MEASGAAASFNVGAPFAGVDAAKLGTEDTVDSTDDEFNLAIKRMSKKDSTTKLKVTNYLNYSVY